MSPQNSKIKLPEATEYHRKLSQLFAKYVIETNIDEYALRGQNDKEKLMYDKYYGTVAEFMVYQHYDDLGKSISFPDIMIYEGRYKSYDADLIIDGYNLHVKSHVVSDFYENSWVFQRKDPLTYHPTNKDYIAFCVINEGENYRS